MKKQARPGAPRGNNNAAGGGKSLATGSGGARLGLGGTLFAGAVGSGLTGMLAGYSGNAKTAARHTKASTITQGLYGGVLGGSAGGPIGAVTGLAIGSALGYGGAKIGQYAGKKMRGRR